jgi:hypothetical protein
MPLITQLRNRDIMNGYPSEQCPKMMVIMEEAAAEIERLRGGLADIAFSEDMTLDIARSKAKRLYGPVG